MSSDLSIEVLDKEEVNGQQIKDNKKCKDKNKSKDKA
jgi:hypothetical protein